MIYELRIYECFAGKLENLNSRFRNHTLSLFEKHGITNVGYWVNDVGPSNNTQLIFYHIHLMMQELNHGKILETIQSGKK